MQEFVIIVAGGSGSRMKSDIPKQFVPVNGLPILMYTIRAFRRYSASLNIILVLPEAQFVYWQQLCSEFAFDERYKLVSGGQTRFHSVKNGLDSIEEPAGLVAVHDGVRPAVSMEIISQSFRQAARSGTAVTCVALKDSIRMAGIQTTSKAMDRAVFKLVQTPQTFRLDWMRDAFAKPYQPHFTDCASVMESAGYQIDLIDGSYENIKITTPEDLQWAGIYLNNSGS